MAVNAQRQAELIRIRFMLGQAFNPSGPVSSRNLFAGRLNQIGQVLTAVGQRGQHVILFGERGVGKTSLASLTHEFWEEAVKGSTNIFPIRYNCTPSDTYGTVWQHIADLVIDLHTKRKAPLPSGASWDELLHEIRSGNANAHSVQRFLSLFDKKFIIVVDEFDQVKDNDLVQEFANTIKGLSDYLIGTTLILVGVADTVDDLISDYASIERALIQVRMPPMSKEELTGIIKQGYESVGLTATTDSLEMMGRLSQGLPHYAHRFGQEAGYCAIYRDSSQVEKDDVTEAINKAIEKTNETIRAAYHKATTSPQTDALFKKVLLACALTATDDLGYFAAADVRDPLLQTAKKRYEIPQFVGHLKKFTKSDKGSVLQTKGEDWSRRYRFSNPLLRPYVVLKGVQDNMIDQDVIHSFADKANKNSGATQGQLL